MRDLALYIRLQRINVARDRWCEQGARSKRIAAMAVKLPYLQGVQGAYGKFIDSVEADAKDFIEKDLAAADEYRKSVFSNAKTRVAEVRASVGAVTKMLDDIDQAMGGNSGVRPTFDDSPPSPSPVDGKLPAAGNIPLNGVGGATLGPLAVTLKP